MTITELRTLYGKGSKIYIPTDEELSYFVRCIKKGIKRIEIEKRINKKIYIFKNNFPEIIEQEFKRQFDSSK